MFLENPETGELHQGLYYPEFLQGKDQYSYFLGQNQGQMKIISENLESEKTLLVIKDSYAHAMIPFLVNHYKEITMVDFKIFDTDRHSKNSIV